MALDHPADQFEGKDCKHGIERLEYMDKQVNFFIYRGFTLGGKIGVLPP